MTKIAFNQVVKFLRKVFNLFLYHNCDLLIILGHVSRLSGKIIRNSNIRNRSWRNKKITSFRCWTHRRFGSVTVNYYSIEWCQLLIWGRTVAFRYVETVFSNLACYNSSFLRPDGSHYGCSHKNHGLNLDLAAETFAQISRIENTTISELVAYN